MGPVLMGEETALLEGEGGDGGGAFSGPAEGRPWRRPPLSASAPRSPPRHGRRRPFWPRRPRRPSWGRSSPLRRRRYNGGDSASSSVRTNEEEEGEEYSYPAVAYPYAYSWNPSKLRVSYPPLRRKKVDNAATATTTAKGAEAEGNAAEADGTSSSAAGSRTLTEHAGVYPVGGSAYFSGTPYVGLRV
mmetsp:Transcript_4149/g.11437  ORF Transcript_4149/g.11437 Transcript_4149/m.11437 type:complete len:188 (-) Transcript_4149:2-565(-)